MIKYFCFAVLKVLFFFSLAYAGIMLGCYFRIKKEPDGVLHFWDILNSHSYIILFTCVLIIADLGFMLTNKWIAGNVEYIDKLGAMFLAISGAVIGSLLSRFLDIYNYLKEKKKEKEYLIIFSALILIASVIAITNLVGKIYISEIIIFVIGILTTMMVDASLLAENDRIERTKSKKQDEG